MRIRGECVLKQSKIERLYNSIRSKHSLRTFVKIIREQNLMKLRITDLKGVIDFLNEELNLQFKLRKDGKKQLLINRIKKELYVNPQGKTGRIAGSIFASSFHPVPLFSRRSQKEQNAFIKIEKDLTLNGHHSFLQPIRSLKEVVMFENGKFEDLKIFVDFTEDEFRGLRSGEDEFHFYCMKNNFQPDFKPVNWHSELFVSVNNYRQDIPSRSKRLEVINNISSRPQGKSANTKNYLIVNSPIRVRFSYLKLRRNLIQLRFPSWIRPSFLIYLAVVSKPRTNQELIPIIEQQTRLYEAKKFVEDQKKRMLDDEDEDEEDEISYSGEEVLTLHDPLLLTRIDIPAKGVTCLHLQVFDLLCYFEFARTSDHLNCPICSKPLPLKELMIDRKVKSMLSQVEDEIEKVKVNVKENTFTPIHPISKKLLSKMSFRVDPTPTHSLGISNHNNNNNNNNNSNTMNERKNNISSGNKSPMLVFQSAMMMNNYNIDDEMNKLMKRQNEEQRRKNKSSMIIGEDQSDNFNPSFFVDLRESNDQPQPQPQPQEEEEEDQNQRKKQREIRAGEMFSFFSRGRGEEEEEDQNQRKEQRDNLSALFSRGRGEEEEVEAPLEFDVFSQSEYPPPPRPTTTTTTITTNNNSSSSSNNRELENILRPFEQFASYQRERNHFVHGIVEEDEDEEEEEEEEDRIVPPVRRVFVISSQEDNNDDDDDAGSGGGGSFDFRMISSGSRPTTTTTSTTTTTTTTTNRNNNSTGFVGSGTEDEPFLID